MKGLIRDPARMTHRRPVPVSGTPLSHLTQRAEYIDGYQLATNPARALEPLHRPGQIALSLPLPDAAWPVGDSDKLQMLRHLMLAA